MAMRDGTRRWLMRLAWGGLLVALSVLVGLRIGRPVYYTDGQLQRNGAELQGSGMLEWGTPEVVVELPGPVHGRVAELPDGRLLYGRGLADGSTDLVVFDPRQPAVPPEPAYGLNSPGNDLAPAVGADGRVYFASDRPAGAGGYDLYVAAWQRGGFAAPEPLVQCNTRFDETDPAPSPAGAQFVFVRIDRAVDGGNDGVLWQCELGSGFEPQTLFAPVARAFVATVDRDPAFTPDGGALWFVRRLGAGPLQLQRASSLQGVFDAPSSLGREWGTGELRAPLPSRTGLRLGLLQPARGDDSAALWFQSTARELYPWWPGQRWLELLLLGVAGSCLLLLLLLHFGRRWSTLDLVAQCLLLSLLLHVLLFLWLMGVEITGALLPGNDDGGGMQVSVVTEASAAGAAAADGPQTANLAALVQFQPELRQLEAAAPGATVERAEAAAVDGPEGAWQREAVARSVEADTAVQDAATAAALALRSGVDATAPTAAAELPAVASSSLAAAAAQQVARRHGEAGAVVVVAPVAALAPAPRSALLEAGEATANAPAAPAARPLEVLAPVLADAGAPAARAAVRDGTDVPAALAPSTAAVASAPAAAASTAAAEASRDVASAPAPAAAAPAPAAALARAAVEFAPGEAVRSAPAAPKAAVGARRPAVALRETPANGTAAAVARAPSPAAGPAAAPLQPLASALAAPLAREVGPLRPRSDQIGRVAPAAVAAPAPAAALERASGAIAAAPSAGVPLAAPAPTTRPRTAAVALRDAAGAPTPAPVATTARAARSTAAPRLDPSAAATLAEPRSAAPFRPRRAAEFGALAAGPIAAAVPGSLLERSVAAPAALPELAVPSPTTPYSNRFGPAKAKALEQFGGTQDTERAVANGLRYLATIQNEDGTWGNRGVFDDKYGSLFVGKTALCVLAFLGAGHTPVSRTEHSAVVQRALAQLLAVQDEDTGAFGPSSCYGHGIATYALAECYGLTKDQALLRPLEGALTWIVQHQGPRRDKKNRGGWGYFSPGLQPEDDYARVSVSSWMVMALESARLSGIELPAEVLPRAREYLEQSFDQPNGWFRYTQKPSRLNSAWPTLPASTPAGAFCLQLLGAPAGDRMVEAALAFTVERRPEAYRRYDDDDFVLRGQGNVYFWYYGSLCCFLAGGDAWTLWNERLRTVLPAAQAKDGSFPPIDAYAREAGDTRTDRSYTTAMCVLSLEVYYRYFTPLLLGR